MEPLPPECASFLAAGEQFSEVYSDRTPISLGRVPVPMVIPVQPQDTIGVDLDDLGPDDEYPEPPTYDVPALDLVETSGDGQPTGLLIWLPVEGCFGSWDCDHWRVRVFPDATWADICAAAGDYLEGGWPDPPGTRHLDPTGRYPERTSGALDVLYPGPEGA